MLTEKELIRKIRQLQQIKPRKEWVVLTKNQIFGEEKREFNFFSLIVRVWKPILALSTLGILLGLFGIAQNSLPGDLLYPIKKITERSQAIFVSDRERPKMELELTNKRLEELNKISQTNQIKKLAPAMNEVQKSLSQTNKNLKGKQKFSREILDQTKKIVDNKEKVEKVLGTQISESKELENTLAQIIESQIKDLETRTLTEEDQKFLTEAKKDFELGNFSEALRKILMLSQNN